MSRLEKCLNVRDVKDTQSGKLESSDGFTRIKPVNNSTPKQ